MWIDYSFNKRGETNQALARLGFLLVSPKVIQVEQGIVVLQQTRDVSLGECLLICELLGVSPDVFFREQMIGQRGCSIISYGLSLRRTKENAGREHVPEDFYPAEDCWIVRDRSPRVRDLLWETDQEYDARIEQVQGEASCTNMRELVNSANALGFDLTVKEDVG